MSKIPRSVRLCLPRIFNIYSEIKCYKLDKIDFLIYIYRKEYVFPNLN